MTQITKRIIVTALVCIAGVIGWMVLGPAPKAIPITKVDFSVLENLKSFTENTPALGNADAVIKKYESTREMALSKAEKFISARNVLSTCSNILCIISIIASFIISILGANKGVLLKPDTVSADLEKVSSGERTFKRNVILCSAIAILSTTLSNRLSSFADKSQSTGYEIIDLIKSADIKISNAINIHEAITTLNTFELDVSKY